MVYVAQIFVLKNTNLTNRIDSMLESLLSFKRFKILSEVGILCTIFWEFINYEHCFRKTF